MLYNYPMEGISDYKQKPDPRLLTELSSEVQDWGLYYNAILFRLLLIIYIDIDEYLPKETKEFCLNVLQQLGYPHDISYEDCRLDGTRVHYEAYLSLRESLALHISSGVKPILAECTKPTGAWNWQNRQAQKCYIDTQAIFSNIGR